MNDIELESGADPDLIPVRMLNEYAYCPRLFHLVHVEGRWAENAFTEEGRAAHRRVDRFAEVLPDPTTEDDKAESQEEAGKEEGCDPPVISRSVSLGSRVLGVVGKLDLVATVDDEAFPVETKRGKPAPTEERCHEPERIQLMAQGLLLREAGYRCTRGAIYFAAARCRVDVPFTAALEARTREVIAQARDAIHTSQIPAPLVESPKCWSCSLNGICLPDETLALAAIRCSRDESESHSESGHDRTRDPAELRRLFPARSVNRPFYIQDQGARVGRKRETFVVTKDGEELAKIRPKDISHLTLLGNVSITPQAIHGLLELGRPVVHMSMSGWFYGISMGLGLRNAFDRAAQFKAAESKEVSLRLARAFVVAKASNQRTLLRRNGTKSIAVALESMAREIRKIGDVASIASLLGHEGSLARHYFQNFGSLLRPANGAISFDFERRNSRPPLDPVNALLSFGYALLAKECTIALTSVGLDPYWGFYHQPRHGKPALALDLMEEFRPVVVDSAVLTAVNTGMVSSRSFITTRQGCSMKPEAKKAFIRAYEARLDQLATHPVFDYRCSWRQMIALQAQLLARHLRGDVPEYRGVTVR